jgi:hypothetical protein
MFLYFDSDQLEKIDVSDALRLPSHPPLIPLYFPIRSRFISVRQKRLFRTGQVALKQLILKNSQIYRHIELFFSAY